MLKRFRPPLAGLVSLLLAGLWLAACGSDQQSQESLPPAQTMEAAAPTVEVTEEVEANQATASPEQTAAAEAPATAVASVSPTAGSTVAPKEASCQAIDIPSNEQVAPVSAEEWSRGPANAPVTLIEYGDFQ